MFKDNTVFVIGAGASAEFGLPLGDQLLRQIKTNSQFELDGYALRSGVAEIYKCIVNRYTKSDEMIYACLDGMEEIYRAVDLAGSIDEFINRHGDDPIIAEVGKLQIAYAISEAERSSHLALTALQPDSYLAWDGSGSWIKTFAQLLFDGVKNGDVDSTGSNISIICFNYDRCIELYLARAIVRTFRGVTYRRALEIVERIEIIHPYGSLGSLTDHPFANKATAEDIRAMSDSIVTWSESQQSDKSEKIQAAMSNASTVVFLGFAFAPQNMKLLTVQNSFDAEEKQIETFATAYGYNHVIDSRLKNKILDLYSGETYSINTERVHIQYEMKCADFLQAHSMALVV